MIQVRKYPDEVTRRQARLDSQRRYRDKNREALRAKGQDYQKRYHRENAEAYNQRKREWWKKNPEYRLKYTYGISVAEWNDLLGKQNNCCAICKSSTPKIKTGWQVDHCHASNKIRGLLCLPCNLTLGKVKDNPNLLRTMADYIEAHRE